MDQTASQVEWKKGSAELLILSLVEARPRHGYEISKLIEQRSGGTVRFHVASLYPLLYRLERRGWLCGRWVEKRSEEHTSELQSRLHLVCRLLLAKKKDPRPCCTLPSAHAVRQEAGRQREYLRAHPRRRLTQPFAQPDQRTTRPVSRREQASPCRL